ncbi:MAG TPA: MoaD/ThiS family protein [Sneathiellales bacterium]|jgi:hypothetical protein|nr:MoaD/ThiS family protein [Sneathiellales bacterium]
MKVTVKLFALLEKYLPRDTIDQTVEVDVTDGASPHVVLAKFGVPPQECHLLLVNGCFVLPSERDNFVMRENDALAAWPPIAGG